MSVHTEVRGATLIVTLDVPKANAINVATSMELYETFVRLRDDATLRSAVLTGAGERFFSAGWDLKAAAEGEAVDAEHSPGGFAGLTEFFDVGKPVIAAVNGLAFGGGFELALSADLIVAADHAEFALPEVQIGIVADSGGLLRIPARVPRAIALEWLLTGRRISAEELLRWGVVNRVVPTNELISSALELANAIEQSAPMAIAAVLEVIRETEGMAAHDAFELLRSGDLPAYRAMQQSEDALEGPRAFAEKRSPVWKGR
ncbi:MAG: enoyl-CoA hydratase-related protein [Actinomycetes bacterium]